MPFSDSPRRSARPPRPRASGKFLFVADTKLWVRGVTYGAFRPAANGREYQDSATIERDFALMAANGLNAVRIPHTMPPLSVLDMAHRYGLRVMVGLSAEQYAGYLIDRRGAPDVAAIVRRKVREVAGHPALLCYALGNEIPAPLVRWLGHRRVEHYLEQLYRAVKTEDAGGLVTYVNYPTTEYLDLSFLDLLAFNVYLETPETFARYLARLQNLAGDRPLLMSELGLDAQRNGDARQAEVLDWQVRTTYGTGCCGFFAFAWTDEWFRAGAEVRDWAFGLTDRARRPRPALAAVRDAITAVPFPKDGPWPRISVVVCSYNGARTLRDCCEGLLRLEYPDFEVIVVDDGSTDETATIAHEYGFRVISTPNRGLSSARNTGLHAAAGEIVAYTDDDARPDPHWLTYLAAAFRTTEHAGIGGPNIAPPGEGVIADAVTAAPGGPIHVLLADEEAEHIPGCNMAFRKSRLESIGGFDPVFRTAGDDVDVCWRIQQRGWSIGFSPAAMVWHHRRASILAYWRQQRGYGKAEALLERKWPEKYNAGGHLSWAGRVYNGRAALGRQRIYAGVWGTAPFQSIYAPASETPLWVIEMPEWWLIVLLLAAVSALGMLWRPVLWMLPIAMTAAACPIAVAIMKASRARFASAPMSRRDELARRAVTALLHVLQPLARLRGRLTNGLSPLRWRGNGDLARPRRRQWKIWSERWKAPAQRLETIETALLADSLSVRRGGDFDRWDLEISGGLLGSTRVLMAVEDHGSGAQLVRLRSWPRIARSGMALIAFLGALAAGAALDGALFAAVPLALGALAVGTRAALESAATTGAVARIVDDVAGGEHA